MRFAKMLGRTYLAFLASGAGTMTGVGLVAYIGAKVLTKQVKPIVDAIKDGELKAEETE